MIPLRADTATDVKIGPFVDVTDGFTPETAVTLSGADEAELLKSGTTGVTDISANAWGAITGCDGYYYLTLSASDLDTEGPLCVVVQDDNVCLPVYVFFTVLNAVAYDALYAAAGTDYLQVDAVQVEGSDATNQIRDSVVDDATRVDASALNTLSGHDPGENIMGATDLNGGVTVGNIGATALANMFDTDSGTTYAASVSGSVVQEIADNAGGSALTAAGIADAVWGEDLTGHQTVDTAGALAQIIGTNWAITGNQLILYDLSGNTLYTFNLTQDGIATEFNPDTRTKV